MEIPTSDKLLSEGKMKQAMEWAYEKAVNGVAGLGSATELAENYMKKKDSPLKQADSLIRWQITKAGKTGFVTGLGGLVTMPVTVPANIASVLYVQIRMIAAIAHIGGHDLSDDRIKSLVYVCLVGNGAREVIQETGIVISKNLTKSAIKAIPGKSLVAINKKVGFRLLTKFGEKGAVNLGKVVPVAGGIVGLAIDAVTTKLIGKVAKKVFISEDSEYLEESDS